MDFKIKYVGDEQEKKCLEMRGLNLMDKIVVVEGARIAFTIWDVGGTNFITLNLVHPFASLSLQTSSHYLVSILRKLLQKKSNFKALIDYYFLKT